MKVLSKSAEETGEVARQFVNSLKSGNTATTVGLFGDLGSGKTTFSQALGKHLGITEFMTSPTFTIMKSYAINFLNFSTLVHIDAYRLEKAHELEVLGFKDLLKDPKNLIVIEWPERVSDILPADLIKIYFKFISENEREITQ
jgi:tRNA threonylcarbamoyladenosine biosynthesis protein TsaE